MPWPCVLLQPTGQAERSLRRFTARQPCPVSPYGHRAVAWLDVVPHERDAEGNLVITDVPRDDPRWPAACACGYVFVPGDYWCVDYEQTYTLPGGAVVVVSAHQGRHQAAPAPIGSMWVVDYITSEDEWVGPDGRCLMVRLPDGADWMIDGPSRSSGRWTRSGEPPHITVHPSIFSLGYHGYLIDGVLTDDLEGRTYGAPARD